VLELVDCDYWWKMLVLPCPPGATPLEAHVRIRQPQGFVQELTTRDVEVRDGRAHVRILYPLLDDGRYDPSHATWNGSWEMGEYQIELRLSGAEGEIARGTMSLDPHSFFPCTRSPIAVDARPQFIECAARQFLYINEDTACFVIRIRKHRVSACEVSADVTSRGGAAVLAGPWRFRLTHEFREQSFDTTGWPTGEYWIRIRVLREGEPVGPFCIRKFWKQVSSPPSGPEVLELGGYPEVLVDDFACAEVEGVQFVPDRLRTSGAPLVAPTAPHEEEMLSVESLTWNEAAQRYECVYVNSGGRLERKDTEPEREYLKLLAVSSDGEHWEKPRLGQVEYEGSRDNNILRDERDCPTRMIRFHKTRKDIMDHDIECAQFRFYDPDRDGSVNLDNVFLASGKRYFPLECKSLGDAQAAQQAADAERALQSSLRPDGLGVLDSPQEPASPDGCFRPRSGEFWPFEKRGDLYLALTREPLLYLGVGMDLMHSSESMRCHVEDTGRKRLLWYFRPAAPAYPPHGAVYDNMHLGLRCLAVLWTDDGLHYHRQFVLGPDQRDRFGTQFYGMGLLQKFGACGDAPGRPVLGKLFCNISQAFPTRNLYLGMVLAHWGIEQTQSPELVWSRDLLHFHRFAQQRRSLIELGAGGSFDAGMIRPRCTYHEFGDEWWYHYTGINTRHNGYVVMARLHTVDEMRREYPNWAEAPYSCTWEGTFADGKATRYLPGVARGKPYRLAHAEAVEGRGRLKTHPLRVDGDTLLINAATEPDGWVLVRVLDETGQPVTDPPVRFQGDATAAPVADLGPRRGQAVVVEFTIYQARLYSFQIA